MPGTQEAEKIAEELGTKFDQFRATHEERYDLIEKEMIALKRPGAGGNAASTVADTKGKAALGAYIKSGDDSGLIELQGKSMSTGSDPDGGFAVPEYLDREVENLELEASAILRLARTVTTTGPS